MSDNISAPGLDRKLLSRPRAIIDAEQKRHDRARARGLLAFLVALFVGGGLAFFIDASPIFRNYPVLHAVLVCVVFGTPLLAAFIALCRVPPPPFEASNDARRDIDRKEREWRGMLLGQILIFGMLAVENFWLWPRLSHLANWLFAVVTFFPMLCMVFIAIYSLYMRAGWLNPDLRRILDDEATQSFRARAQRLGYLILLFILLGFSVLAQISARIAAHYLPVGLAAGIAIPVLYFVYLDWQASRGG